MAEEFFRVEYSLPAPVKKRCKYNDYIECVGKRRPCVSCGWNPKVAEMRKIEALANNSNGKVIRISSCNMFRAVVR